MTQPHPRPLSRGEGSIRPTTPLSTGEGLGVRSSAIEYYYYVKLQDFFELFRHKIVIYLRMEKYILFNYLRNKLNKIEQFVFFRSFNIIITNADLV
jgi:hypothetical protein